MSDGLVLPPSVPGTFIDVRKLLDSLDADTLVKSVKAAVFASQVGCEAPPVQVRLKADGMTVDVPQLLLSLGRRGLLASVRRAVESRPDAKRQLVQELRELVSVSAGGLPVARLDSSATGRLPRLPTDGIARSSPTLHRPPRAPGGGTLRDVLKQRLSLKPAASCVALPRLAPHSVEEPKSVVLLRSRLRQAVRAGHLEDVRAWLAHGADMDSPDAAGGASPTAAAVLQGVPHGVLRELLEARADVHRLDAQGRSLVHLWSWNLPKSRSGVKEEHKKLALLLRHGAALGQHLPGTGDTPLHVLARVAEQLKVNGPPSGRRDAAGGRETEKFLAATESRMQLLLTARANPYATNFEGTRPIDFAAWAALPALAGPSQGAAGPPQPVGPHKAQGVRLEGGCSAVDGSEGTESVLLS